MGKDLSKKEGKILRSAGIAVKARTKKGRKIVALLALVMLIFSSCSGTTIQRSETEVITKVYGIEAESEEELAELISRIPDTIEEDGKVYKRVEAESGEERTEGKISFVYEETTSDDPVYNHRDEIKAFIKTYWKLLTIAILGIILAVLFIKELISRYILWW